MQSEIFSNFLRENFKVGQKDFSRNRKQSFAGTVLFMVNFLTRSLSLEIVNFLEFLKKRDIAQQPFTKSAFVQVRKKIKHQVFVHLNSKLTEEFYTDNPGVRTKFGGLRILAIDGSRITLPFTKELENIYGKTKNQTEAYLVQAKACVLYDVLNKVGISGVFSSIGTDERVQAEELLDNCVTGDLLVYDRGYPSFGFFYEHCQRRLDFVMRMRLDFSQVVKDFVQSGKKSQIVEMGPGKNTDFRDKAYQKNSSLKVRLVRVMLPGEEVEVLATSLLDSGEFKNDIFKELYFERWKIETYYDELKNKLKVETFSGYSNQSVLQDFYAAMLVSNVQTLIVEELNEELQVQQKNKYQYKVNTSLSYGFMKDRVLSLFLGKNSMVDIIDQLKLLFSKHLIPIRPNRSNKREVGKYRRRIKPKVTKNQKDSL